MGNLDRILAQLDREGATELAIVSGRPVALRIGGQFQSITTTVVSLAQMVQMISDTALAALWPRTDGTGDPLDIDLGRPVRVQFIKQGAEVMLRILPRPGRTRTPTRNPAAPEHARPAAVARSRAATGPRPASKTTPPRPQRKSTGRVAVAAVVSSPQVTQVVALVDDVVEVPPAFGRIVEAAANRGATDLHVAAERPLYARIRGELVALDQAVLPAREVAAMLLPLLGPARERRLGERGYVDLAVIASGRRLRGNIARHQGGLKGAFRIAMAEPPSLAQLGLPPELEKVVAHHQGLVVVAGPSGHGKTTTLAALVDRLNSTRPIHILSVEDPVEIEHPRKLAVISQREVGRHTLAFASALKAALRQDPDVIVIGELRDRETVAIALAAAETGHLVIATMSTPSAAKTIDRLIDMFPPEDQNQVRTSLAGALRAVVAQRLVPSEDGVVAAIELVTGVLPLATLIRENKLFQLPSLVQRGRAFGMIRLDESLLELVRAGKVTAEAAAQFAENKRDFATASLPAAPTTSQAVKRAGLFGRKGNE